MRKIELLTLNPLGSHAKLVFFSLVLVKTHKDDRYKMYSLSSLNFGKDTSMDVSVCHRYEVSDIVIS